MTARVIAQLARCTGTATCSRCLDVVDVRAGHWIAGEAAETHRAVCDTCSERDDPDGHTTLLAWRRAANGPATGTRNRS
jgi:hypothetical protein